MSRFGLPTGDNKGYNTKGQLPVPNVIEKIKVNALPYANRVYLFPPTKTTLPYTFSAG